MNIAILGAGAWGTALAIALSSRHAVALWTRDRAGMSILRDQRCNDRYLPGHSIPPAVQLQDDIAAALQNADVIIIATSTAGLAETATAAAKLRAAPIIWLCKGFDAASGKLPHEIMSSFSDIAYGALSGPSFAQEAAQGLPTALTLAMNDETSARQLASELNGGNLRVYSNPDLIGVELGGALKNIMAIAAGISDGMQLGTNARAALITRGLAEMTRLGIAMGARPETFMGLTGLGDLVLTTTGGLSRNRNVGLQLAAGKPLATILHDLGHVAEGVNSAAIARSRARALGVEMPITEAVAALLFDGADPRDSLKRLMGRDPKAE